MTQTVTPEQQELIRRFIDAYNGIQKRLASELKMTPEEQLYRLIDAYTDRYPTWERGDGRWLRDIAPLRNALVHGGVTGATYLAVPLEQVVTRIEAVHDRLLHPRLAIPAFARQVLTLDASDTIASALAQVRENNYSQFPVYSGGAFQGLLTENGITRWLARAHAGHETSIVDLEEERVDAVLALEEARESWAFVCRCAPIDEVFTLFLNKPLLEAVLITHSGKPSEKLLGIATRWDAFEKLVHPQAR